MGRNKKTSDRTEQGSDASVGAAIDRSESPEGRTHAEDLKFYNGNLEALVAERTKALSDANELLRKEVSERRRVEHELRKRSAAIDQSVNLIFITDSRGVIEYVNPTFEKATGWTSAQAVGKSPGLVASGETPPEDYASLWKTILSGDTWRGILKNRKRSGELYWVNATISPIRNHAGEITHFLAVQEDVTEKRTSSEKIRYLEHYDATTGLINRGRFIGLMSELLSGGEGEGGALVLLDIDQFKFISDSYGHGMGDEYLRRVGRLLQITIRYLNAHYLQASQKDSLICRLSGDEFAIFVPGAGGADAVMVAEQVRKGLEGFYQADIPCHLTASIGVALCPEHGTTTTELLTKADAAMYRAKDLGRNRFHLYTPEERDIEQMHTRLKWKEGILLALEEDRFEAWYQPIRSLDEGGVRHFEVLARMTEADGSVVLPGPFIDIAERFGLVSSIARVIMRKAFTAQALSSANGRPTTFCVNVSGKELGDREFLHDLQSLIAKTGADPAHIVLEITETASILDMDRAMGFIRELKSMGCSISLDDFGIGFTSFLYLKEMEVDYIKIAGAFIKNLDRNLNDQLFVKAITSVAGGMGIKTIAEFVETEEVCGLLKAFGVDYGQGYLIGRPSKEIVY